MKPFIRSLLYVILILVLASCSSEEVQEVQGAKTVETLSIGTIGDDAVELVLLYQPTIDYLAQKLSTEEIEYEGKVIVSKTVDDAIVVLKNQELDIFIDSPLTAAAIASETDAQFMLRRWKKGVSEYYSVFIVTQDSPIASIADFPGKILALESPESTSGYALPSYFLLDQGFDLEEGTVSQADKISYYFSGEDINTVTQVIEGRADIGALSNTDLDSLEESISSKVRIVNKTIAVPRHVVITRSGLDEELFLEIKDLLLDMKNDEEGNQIMLAFKDTVNYDEIPNIDNLMVELDNILTVLDSQ